MAVIQRMIMKTTMEMLRIRMTMMMQTTKISQVKKGEMTRKKKEILRRILRLMATKEVMMTTMMTRMVMRGVMTTMTMMTMVMRKRKKTRRKRRINHLLRRESESVFVKCLYSASLSWLRRVCSGKRREV